MQFKTIKPELGINLQRSIRRFNYTLSKHSIDELINSTNELDIPKSVKCAIATAKHSKITDPYKLLALSLIIFARRLNGNRVGKLFACDLVDILYEDKFYWSEYYHELAIKCLNTIKQCTIDKYLKYLEF